MRAFLFVPALAVSTLLIALPPSALAQDLSPNSEDPSVIDPPEAPGAVPDFPMPPSPDGEEPPMVMPAPDETPEAPPEAFGSPLDDEASDGEDTAEQPDGAPGEDEAATSQTEAERLDSLFSELRKTADETDGRRIARQIERSWRKSGSETVDLLMSRAAQAMGHEQGPVALDVLDQALVLDPDFPEAWNRRATVHFSLGEYGKSLADIEQVLAREPRHWGAIMGLALILQRTGRDEGALQAYQEVLTIYPSLKSAQDAVGKLAETLTGPAI